MWGDLLRTACRRDITEAAGEAREEGATVIVGTDTAVDSTEAGVAETGSTISATSLSDPLVVAASLGGGSGGGSRHLTLLMLSFADLFSSLPRF